MLSYKISPGFVIPYRGMEFEGSKVSWVRWNLQSCVCCECTGVQGHYKLGLMRAQGSCCHLETEPCQQSWVFLTETASLVRGNHCPKTRKIRTATRVPQPRDSPLSKHRRVPSARGVNYQVSKSPSPLPQMQTHCKGGFSNFQDLGLCPIAKTGGERISLQIKGIPWAPQVTQTSAPIGRFPLCNFSGSAKQDKQRGYISLMGIQTSIKT